MADNTYSIDLLATGIATVTVTDDATGSDWLEMTGVYVTATDIRLSWASTAGISNQAMGFYFNPTGTGHRLVVNGLIENVRGSNGLDYIQGNEQNNILYGDNAATGAGLADSIYGYDGNDTIYGGAGADIIDGAIGNDSLRGDAGSDSINGGAGNDTIIGGAGADSMAGGSDARDMVSYAGSNARVLVDITYGSATIGSGGHAQGDTIRGFADVMGSSYGDAITDTNAGTLAFGYNDNRFYGAAGNDMLYGGGGDDRLYGGLDDDWLEGGIGNDKLYGGDGIDVLRGGIGLDSLYGGLGVDYFSFTTAAESTAAVAGRDLVFDFSRTQGDQIDLAGFDADPSVAGSQMFIWRGTLGFSGHHGEVRVVNSGSNSLVMADLNGDSLVDFSILVLNVNNMTSNDFTLAYP